MIDVLVIAVLGVTLIRVIISRCRAQSSPIGPTEAPLPESIHSPSPDPTAISHQPRFGNSLLLASGALLLVTMLLSRGGLWLSYPALLVVFALLVLFMSGLSNGDESVKVQAVLSSILLIPALTLLSDINRLAEAPSGGLLNVFVMLPKDSEAVPELKIVLRERYFHLACASCSPTSPVLIALGESDLGPSVADVGSRKGIGVRNVGTGSAVVRGREAEVSQTLQMFELSEFSDIVVTVKNGQFITHGSPRSLLEFPSIGPAQGEVLAAARDLAKAEWIPARHFKVEAVAGSAQSPTGSGDADYRIDFVDPPPTRVDRFFITWEADLVDRVFGPTATVVSPSRERSLSQKTILVGALAGAGSYPFASVVWTGALRYRPRVRRVRRITQAA